MLEMRIPVHAYNTGVDDRGEPLTTGAADIHWWAVLGPVGFQAKPARVVDDSGFLLPINPSDQAPSRPIWINTSGEGYANEAYSFRQVVDLTDFVLESVVITIRWSIVRKSDAEGEVFSYIRVAGTPIPNTNFSQVGAWTECTISQEFLEVHGTGLRRGATTIDISISSTNVGDVVAFQATLEGDGIPTYTQLVDFGGIPVVALPDGRAIHTCVGSIEPPPRGQMYQHVMCFLPHEVMIANIINVVIQTTNLPTTPVANGDPVKHYLPVGPIAIADSLIRAYWFTTHVLGLGIVFKPNDDIEYPYVLFRIWAHGGTTSNFPSGPGKHLAKIDDTGDGLGDPETFPTNTGVIVVVTDSGAT